MRNTIVVLSFLFLLIFSTAVSAEDVTLTSVMPAPGNPNRSQRAAIGATYSNLPEASVPANSLLVEGNIAIGRSSLDHASTTSPGWLEAFGGIQIGDATEWTISVNTNGSLVFHNVPDNRDVFWMDASATNSNIAFGSYVGTLYTGAAQHNPTTGKQAVFTINPSGTGGGTLDEIWIGPNTGTIKGYLTLSATRIYMQGSYVYFNSTLKWSSDMSLKKDVVTIPNALERVCALRGVNFRWKDENLSKDLCMGVVGQEVERVFPELVTTNPDDNNKYVSYDSLVGALIEAIKDQQKEIKDQQKEIDSLKSDVAGLKAKLG